MFMYDKRLIILLLLAIMTAIAMIPAGAYAASEKTTFQQEYTYREGETPNIPQEIIQFGHIFTLVSVSEPVATAALPAKRSYTYQVSASYTPEQLSQAPKNTKLKPVYGTGKRQVDRRETVDGLPDNDVERLAQTKVYKDTNGRGPGARRAGELVLAEVKYEPVGRDEYGIPNDYKAHVVYRGEERYRALLSYNAVTTYTDTAAEDDGVTTYTVVATYEGDAPGSDGYDEPAVAGTGGDDSGGADAIGSGITDTHSAVAALKAFLFRLPFSLGALSPFGAAAIATIAAAALTLVFLGVYNKRRLREST